MTINQTINKIDFEKFLTYLDFKELLYIKYLLEYQNFGDINRSINFSTSEIFRIQTSIIKKAKEFYGTPT